MQISRTLREPKLSALFIYRRRMLVSNTDVCFIYLLWTDVRNIKGLAFLEGHGVVRCSEYELCITVRYYHQILAQ